MDLYFIYFYLLKKPHNMIIVNKNMGINRKKAKSEKKLK